MLGTELDMVKSFKMVGGKPIAIVIIMTLLHSTDADIYLHNPRGSNNRLNENTAARTNNNRLFDSQNNNRGGYNVGDEGNAAAGGDEKKQYQMRYFQSSSNAATLLQIEWTMQHGCGANTDQREVDCNVILQYNCQDQDVKDTDPKIRFRDGTSTDAQDYTAGAATETPAQYTGRRTNNLKSNRGLHESWNYYDNCYHRQRNQGLFTADQKLGQSAGMGYSSAIFTRQNANGNRNAYECPEERDYYPYWHPTMWTDIAVLVSDPSDCSTLQQKSHNVVAKHECIEYFPGSLPKYSRWNNQKDCKANEGHWRPFYNYLEKATGITNRKTCEGITKPGLKFIWGRAFDGNGYEECLITPLKPDCKPAPWSRANHLGNDKAGKQPHYTWTLPYFPSGRKKMCMLRIRYNISTYDIDLRKADAKLNINGSPLKQNPTVNIVGKVPLQLAINTAQYGRTFQDRSHVFQLLPRPKELEYHRIHNLNVRGKRGNIVQVYPAVEYDFTPQELRMNHQDLVHIQWTGSNTHNNKDAGNDGVGTDGTDRHNIVQIKSHGVNFPLPVEASTLWQDASVKWSYYGLTNTKYTPNTLAVNMASAGYYKCLEKANCPTSQTVTSYVVGTNGGTLNNVLNNAPASFPGHILQLKKGTYHVMCTRNNNFSNRSQKGAIIVS